MAWMVSNFVVGEAVVVVEVRLVDLTASWREDEFE